MIFDVTVYGALGGGDTDPTADDSAAFAAALAAAGAAGGGVVRVPTGYYRLRSPLGPLPTNVRLIGESPADPFNSSGSVLLFDTGGEGVIGLEVAGNVIGRTSVEDIAIVNATRPWSPGLAITAGDRLMPARYNTSGTFPSFWPHGVVLEAVTSGVTGGSEPRWPATLGATVVDNDEITWRVVAATGVGLARWTPDTPMSPGRLVHPPEPNGHIYRCVTADFLSPEKNGTLPTTGTATAPGTFPTILGQPPVKDGDVTWLPLAPRWAAGVAVAEGDYVQPSVPNGYVYCAYNSGVTAAVEPATWPTGYDIPPFAEAGGGVGDRVTWGIAGSLPPDGPDPQSVQVWNPDWVVGEGQMALPVRPNGFYYVCSSPGRTGPTEPEPWPTALGSELMDNSARWKVGGRIAVGLRFTMGTLCQAERVRLSGWAVGAFVDGTSSVDLSHLYLGGSGEVGVLFPAPNTVGVLLGSEDQPDTTNNVIVRHSQFNIAETGVFAAIGANHRISGNVFQCGDYTRAGRLGSRGGVLANCSWDNNTTGDATSLTLGALWIDRVVTGLTLQSNTFYSRSAPAILVESTVYGLN